MKRIAINGFGRIGRLTYRQLLTKDDVEVVAVNDLTDNGTLVHLLKYDSVQGRFPGQVDMCGEDVFVNGKELKMFTERNPSDLPWGALNIDVVIESTGVFRDLKGATQHLNAGAKRVIISAPAKGDDIETVVLGVNDEVLSGDELVISNASCTTNCSAPMVKILNDAYGVEQGMLNTIHAYTADQRIQDSPHRDLRRARAAAYSIVPTSTGAAKAIGLVIPEMKGKLDGMAARVPVATGSFVDFTLILKKETTEEAINQLMRKAAEGPLKGILEYTEDPIVSADIIGNEHSCIFDSQLTMVSGNMVKICGWYDNEMGYSARLADVTIKMAELAGSAAT